MGKVKDIKYSIGKEATIRIDNKTEVQIKYYKETKRWGIQVWRFNKNSCKHAMVSLDFNEKNQPEVTSSTLNNFKVIVEK